MRPIIGVGAPPPAPAGLGYVWESLAFAAPHPIWSRCNLVGSKHPDAVSMPAPPTGLGMPTPFDGQAPQFDRRVGLPEADCRAIAGAVLALAGAGPGDRVLEIGAGTGMIGRWFLEHPVRYVGLDLSRGMLEVFRRRPGAPRAGLVQADGARPWPLPAGAAQVVFSSRAVHLLPLAQVVDEVFRTLSRVAGGGALVLGWVERRPDSVKARMSRRMQRLVRERGFAPRTAGGPGLGGVVLPPGVQESVLEELEAWAARTFGGLDATTPAEETYVLEGVRLPAAARGRQE